LTGRGVKEIKVTGKLVNWLTGRRVKEKNMTGKLVDWKRGNGNKCNWKTG